MVGFTFASVSDLILNTLIQLLHLLKIYWQTRLKIRLIGYILKIYIDAVYT
jgi:hypothetical protein